MRGEIRSGFSMTEPDSASSDATNVETAIVRDGDEYVINGKKWWTSGFVLMMEAIKAVTLKKAL